MAGLGRRAGNGPEALEGGRLMRRATSGPVQPAGRAGV